MWTDEARAASAAARAGRGGPTPNGGHGVSNDKLRKFVAARQAAVHAVDLGAATAALASGPKSAPVGTHPAMTQSFGDISKALNSGFDRPRNHAAEQRSFNSGAREIARLKRQGK